MTGHTANPDAEVDLDVGEDAALTEWWVNEGGDHEDLALDGLVRLVESIVAARLAPVKAERDELALSYAPLLSWTVERAERFADECGASADSLFVAWIGEQKRAGAAEQQAADLRAELDGLRASIEALADEWETAHGDPPVDPSHISVRHAKALAALLGNPGTALDAVRAEAKAEALREAADEIRDCDGSDLMRRLLALDCNRTAKDVAEWAESLLRDRADALTDTRGGQS